MVTTERGNNEALRPTSRLGSQRSTVNSSTFDVSSVLKNLRPESPSNTSNRGKQADEDYVNHYPLSAAGPQLSGECAVQDDQCTNTNAVWEIQAQDSSVNSEKCHYPLRADFVIGNKSFVKFPRSSSFYNSRPYYHSSPRTSMSSSTVLPLKRATSSPSRTSLTASQSFLQTPGPLNDFIRCRIERSKSGILSGPTRYTMTFESFPPDFPNTFGIVTAVRSSRPYAPARFQIHLTDASDISGHQECVAELRASFLGTEYRLFGCQSHSGKNSDSNVGRLSSEGEDTASLTPAWHGKKSKSRPIKHELCSVTYAQNMLGTQGPRRALVLLPKLVLGPVSAWDLQPYNMDNMDDHSSLLDRYGVLKLFMALYTTFL